MDTLIGILAIGNEVVEGQINNRNAAWLSQELAQLGMTSLYHLSCRDRPEEIQKSLHFLGQHTQLIIVSGGLGPTTDDCTRQNISQWCQSPLAFSENEWLKIKNKLEARKLTLRDGHKNQAYIPEGAFVLANDKGVAPGFFIKTKNGFLASLPGPPSELQPMFNNYLKPLILEKFSPKNEKKLYTWTCLGAAESEVAHIVESLVGKNYELGFRINKPYVEVKIWAPSHLTPQDIKIFKTISEKLSPWYVADTVSTIRKQFSEIMNRYSKVFIVDHLSFGLFLERLKEGPDCSHIRYQCFENDNFNFLTENEVKAILSKMPIESNQLMIALFPASENSLYLSYEGKIEHLTLPRSIQLRSSLGQLYIIEECFIRIINSHGQS